MTGIAVKALDSAGGAQLAGGQDFFIVQGQPVVVIGDPVQAHGQQSHASPVMAEGESWFTVNGIPVCRAGHLATCGHASTGRAWFTVTGAGA